MVERILNIEQEQIDRRATRKRVESVLEAVRKYRAMGCLRRENGAISNRNELFKVAEREAIYPMSSEENLLGECGEVEQAISLLDEQEQGIIRERYLKKDKTFDFLLFHELNLSERTYHRIKARAIEQLAYMLRLEVKVQ
ncbi:ArpU family transcriptional regulator [Paenibacillus sp. LMG 31461]|uniref:ArpU family transcriptional regulator n=1 Tax=Paenibacillus plantarum TaxID=2654975 RepID=A0ABX1XAM2_9BACL|nr:ArpU family phage packaging/lysis transcriptional regulator [Paenibacillus plantarum]NOU65226.1 ArpU family transcriptional regulator [Paenibacillus plantarum]